MKERKLKPTELIRVTGQSQTANHKLLIFLGFTREENNQVRCLVA